MRVEDMPEMLAIIRDSMVKPFDFTIGTTVLNQPISNVFQYPNGWLPVHSDSVRDAWTKQLESLQIDNWG